MKLLRYFLFLSLVILIGCNSDEDTPASMLIERVFVGSTQLYLQGDVNLNTPVDQSISIIFSQTPDQSSIASAVKLTSESGVSVSYDFNLSANSKTLVLYPSGILLANTVYHLQISNELRGAGGERFEAIDVSFKTIAKALEIVSIKNGNVEVIQGNRIVDLPLNLNLSVEFSTALDPQTVQNAISLSGPGVAGKIVTLSSDSKTLTLSATTALKHLTRYDLQISNTLKSVDGGSFSGTTRILYTTVPDQPQQPIISDEDLLTKVQQQTFKYFWDFAHPSSGMARERNTSGDIVTIGGSGFGLMTIIVGIERGFITRQQGIERLSKIVGFLETADRFHGAWSHWVNGNTGDVVPFSTNDNGGDLVETSFLVEGLITFRQYLDNGNATESALITRINSLVNGVEWDWYTRGGQNVLYWHWSPDKEWIMNHPIKGYNECLITYVLAASSTTHSTSLPVYQQGWASNGALANGKSFYGITLPLGFDYGGPLFFTHYSFLGLDPRNLQDQYANYWTQNVNHSLINHQYSVVNPQKYVGYSDENWGLTASDNQSGYSAHSPTNDLGVITPTAALSSFPYTPEQSMKAMKFFYYQLGDRLWGQYGFYDAFNLTEGWTASSYLAIDQGPIVIMIENHRTGLLWDLFMSAPEVKAGLTKLNFTY